MNWVDIIVIILLILSVIGGLREGAPKNTFSLAAQIIAIPCAGFTYGYLAALLSFIPGNNWENFIAFFILMGIFVAILHFVSLIPRKLLEKIWGKGVFFRLGGGVLNLLNACLGLTVFMLVLNTYPIIDWLVNVTGESAVLAGLVRAFGFIQLLLPEGLRIASQLVAVITGAIV